MTHRDPSAPQAPFAPALLGATVRAGTVGASDGAGLPPVETRPGPVLIRAGERAAWIEVRDVARYLVEDGALVTVDVATGAAPVVVRRWLHGIVTAFIVGQQGRFALHASVVDVDGMRVAVAGDSGAGKSTTVLALAEAGGRVVSDDVAVLQVTPQRVVSIPYGRGIHVAPDTAAALGHVPEGDAPVVDTTGKIVTAAPPAEPAPLDVVVALRAGAVAAVTIRSVASLAVVPLVRRFTYRGPLLARVYPEAIFAWQVAVAHRIRAFEACRPDRGDLRSVADAIRDAIGAGRA